MCYVSDLVLQWEYFFDQLDPLMARLAYMVNPGNHESDSKDSKYIPPYVITELVKLLWLQLFSLSAYYQGHDSGGECNVPYVKRFRMPRESDDHPW